MDWFWIGFGLVLSKVLLFCFANSQFFKNANPFQLFYWKHVIPSSKVKMVYVSYVSGTTRLVSVVVGHYWIGFGEERIGFGLVSRCWGHYWIGYTLSETQMV